MMNIKRLTILFLITFTCFLTQCNGCQEKKNDVPLKWGKITVSCGFPAPYFDFKINENDKGQAVYSADSWEKLKTGAPINIIFIFVLSWVLTMLKQRKNTDLKRLAFIAITISIFFSTALLYPYYPELLKNIAVYIYVYPVAIIESPLRYFLSEPVTSNAGPRIYFILMTVLVYLVISGFKIMKSKMKSRK